MTYSSCQLFYFGVDRMNFSERIVQLKENRKVLQKDIAQAVGVTPRNYQRYEKGTQQPTLPVLLNLAEYFDVSLDYLVGRTDNPNSHKS